MLSAILIRGLAGIGQGIVLGLRRDLFDHLTSLSLRYFSEQRAGWIIARLTSDVDALSDALSQGLPTLAANVVLLPTAIVAVFIVDWRLGMISFIVLPPALVLTRWFQRTSSVAQLEVRNRIAAVTAHMAESVAGMAIVQAFNRERAFQDEFDALNEREPHGQRPHADAAVVLLPVDRAAGADLHHRRAAARRAPLRGRATSASAR